MILPRPGKLSEYYGRWFHWERLYPPKGKGSIWCRVKLRYWRTLRDMNKDQREVDEHNPMPRVKLCEQCKISLTCGDAAGRYCETCYRYIFGVVHL